MKLLITAGPTREALDPMRFLSNRSTGKMGYALAESAVENGFEVTLISGPCALTPPEGLHAFIPVVSAADMAEAVKNEFPGMDAAIMCAAVADYRPKTFSSSKIKRSLFLAPIIQSASMPRSLNHFTCGYTGAAPTPPATNKIRFILSSERGSSIHSQ